MRIRISLLLVVFVFVTSPAFSQKRNITEKDLFNFVWIGDPQVSPDGSQIAFVRVVVNDRKDGYNTSIWTVLTSNDGHRMESFSALCGSRNAMDALSNRNSSCYRCQEAKRFSSLPFLVA